jgi:Domain of unknown function (DUF5666)
MRFRTILGLATLFLTCFTLAVWSQPLSSKALPAGAAAENQSLKGKISSVGDASFEVAIASKEGQTTQTVQFLVDDKTRVEGKLNVGAEVQVEYRSDEGRNIAVHVVVNPTSTHHSH